jgi:pimeloyl-ACP methyl ester carboxylesterase
MSKAQTLAFEEYGLATEPVLIILHGFFASSRNWRSIARNLADEFHVYLLDMRNHGESAHNAIMDYPSMAADIETTAMITVLTQINTLPYTQV